MAKINIEWLDEAKTIIHAHFDGQLSSWSEQEEAGLLVIALAKTVSHPVYIVASFGPSFVGPPRGTGNPFRSFQKFATNLPVHVVMVINTGTNPIEFFLITMFMRIHPTYQSENSVCQHIGRSTERDCQPQDQSTVPQIGFSTYI